jgi:AcrR family transcriptional regulator
MPRPRFEKLEESRRRALLDAAAEELAAKGYELASINVILEEARFSKGSFYYYFDDKADLAAAVLREAYGPVVRALGEVQTPASIEDFWREVNRLNRVSLDALEASPRTFQLVTRTGSAVMTEPSLQAHLAPMMTYVRERMRGLWAAGQALGAVRQDVPVDTLMAMVEAVKRAAWQSTSAEGHVPTVVEVEAFAEQVLDLAQRLAAPASPTQPRSPAV